MKEITDTRCVEGTRAGPSAANVADGGDRLGQSSDKWALDRNARFIHGKKSASPTPSMVAAHY